MLSLCSRISNANHHPVLRPAGTRAHAPLRSMVAPLGSVASPIAPSPRAGFAGAGGTGASAPHSPLLPPLFFFFLFFFINIFLCPVLNWGKTAGRAAGLEARPPDNASCPGAAQARGPRGPPQGPVLSCDERSAASARSGGPQSLSELAAARPAPRAPRWGGGSPRGPPLLRPSSPSAPWGPRPSP